MRPPKFRLAAPYFSAGVAALCMTLPVSAKLVAKDHGTAAGEAGVGTVAAHKLTSEQRVEQALGRLTFGARPGEVSRVQHAGLDRWLDTQLHPDTIDDSVLEERLSAFPALRLSQADLIKRFPGPAMLRMGERRGLDLPSDPVERSIYADASEAYAARKEGKGEGVEGKNQGAEAKTPAAHNFPLSAEDLAVGESRGAGAGTQSAGSAASAGHGVEERSVLHLPPEQRFTHLVAMSPKEMLAFREGLRGPDRLLLLQGLTPEQRESVEAMTTAPVRVVGAELLQARLLRDLFSERQLQAVMVDFWLNHFNIYARKNQNEPYLLPAFQREVILPYALGRFEDLLVATAKSPAMLMYLDNWLSIGPDSVAAARVARLKERQPNGKVAKNLPQGINENYARELMELHTLGVNGGYTQKDVIEVARCLTGWTIDRPNQGAEYRFDDARHEPGPKTVLGKTIAGTGEQEGLAVLHLLATSPATAHFLSQKLAIRFVSDVPPPALVKRMEATYLHTDGDISAVLRTMVQSQEFFAPETYKAKVKTPLEFVTSAVRISGATVDNDLALVGALNRLGMPLYGMQTPNGYSWTADEWVSSNALVSRMNLALVMSSNRLPGVHMTWSSASGPETKPDATAQEARLEDVLLGGAASDRTRAAVVAGAQDATAQREAEQHFRETAPARVNSPASAMIDPQSVEGPARLMRTKAAGKASEPRVGAKAFAPESPLDTMAGLLLGSPEFQRR